MELTKNQIKITKGIAILFMILLHLFCTKSYKGEFTPILIINDIPLIYYFALFSDCCVAIYCFCSGYGLYISFNNNNNNYIKNNIVRIIKLYTRLWIVIIIFVVILGPLTGMQAILPGNIQKFILNLTAINPSYNGAWWFLSTYILLIIASPIIYKIIKEYNNKVITIIIFIIYFISYIQRVKGVIQVNNEIEKWVINQCALLGTSLFPFVIGGMFASNKIYSKLYIRVKNIKHKNMVGTLLICVMIIAHGFIQSLFIAVFTGIAFICIFNLMDKPIRIEKILIFLSNHSTNLWLIHTFFYKIYFYKVVFKLQYPLLIYVWLITLCLPISFGINIIEKFIYKYIDKYRKNNLILYKN